MDEHIDSYCCIELLRAVRGGYLNEVVSGIFFPNKDGLSCKDGVPRLDFCPFCQAKIRYERVEMKSGFGWRWWTEK